MFSPDLRYQLIIAIALLLFSGVSTCFFVYNRWNLNVMIPRKRWGILLTIFILTIVALLSLQFVFEQSFEIWLLIYAVTISIITLGDFITFRLKAKSLALGRPIDKGVNRY